jgi:hypothetical protein
MDFTTVQCQFDDGVPARRVTENFTSEADWQSPFKMLS